MIPNRSSRIRLLRDLRKPVSSSGSVAARKISPVLEERTRRTLPPSASPAQRGAQCPLGIGFFGRQIRVAGEEVTLGLDVVAPEEVQELVFELRTPLEVDGAGGVVSRPAALAAPLDGVSEFRGGRPVSFGGNP